MIRGGMLKYHDCLLWFSVILQISTMGYSEFHNYPPGGWKNDNKDDICGDVPLAYVNNIFIYNTIQYNIQYNKTLLSRTGKFILQRSSS